MALDDESFDNEQASSVLKALRENDGVRARRAEIEGNTYSSGHYFGSVTNGTEVNVFIENPANSGVVLFPQATFRCGGAIRYNKVDSVTVDTAGTPLTSQNRLISADDNSQARIEYNVSFSGGESWTQKASGGAQAGGGLAPADVSGFGVILQEGENLVYRATNISGGGINITIDVDYVELDKQVISEFAD